MTDTSLRSAAAAAPGEAESTTLLLVDALRRWSVVGGIIIIVRAAGSSSSVRPIMCPGAPAATSTGRQQPLGVACPQDAGSMHECCGGHRRQRCRYYYLRTFSSYAQYTSAFSSVVPAAAAARAWRGGCWWRAPS